MNIMDQKILSRIDGAVATLTFNNPERHNAMSLEMWQAATTALVALIDDPAVRVIVLTGAGGKAFVSGADISKFESERASADGVATYNAAVESFSKILYDCSQPTIAMIRGYCIGGGIGIAVCCDLRLATENSRFGVPAAKLGLGYGMESLRRLMQLIGPQFTAEMLFTARQFDATEAAQMGLINRVLPESEIESYVADMAQTIAGNAPLTIRAAKRIIRELLRDGVVRDTRKCGSLVDACFESEDYREGRRAFLEKRKPVFKGK
ncbi:MAG: enoyl-CoA hydratase/isomerase family protein [Acidobacteriia bacterium]|nr:enoyl-CoA hydratase/isomerase family protein [Terriglobia bacterium]